MITLNKSESKGYYLLNVGDTTFEISEPLGNYLKESDSLNDTVIEKVTASNGVTTLKIKSLTYRIVKSDDTKSKSKRLNIYKLSNQNKKGVKNMRVLINFIKKTNEDGTIQKNKFSGMVLHAVLPEVKDKDFTSWDEVKTAIEKGLEGLKSEQSTWTIENNSKQEGLVVKNEYIYGENGETAHHIFFVNKFVEKKK